MRLGREPQPLVHVAQAEKFERARARRTLTGVLLLACFVGVIGMATAPEAFSLALLVLVLACIAAMSHPVLGVYAIIAFTLVGDAQTTPWWPFTKNMSSRESVFFVSDALSITPLEVVLGVTTLSLLLRALVQRSVPLRRGRLLWPILVFFVFVVYGFGNGYVTGGDRNVAILEARPLFYIAIVYFLATNLLVTRVQYRIAFTVAMIAVAIQSIASLTYYRTMPEAKRAVIETLAEHTATVHMNAVLLFVLGLALFKGTRWKLMASLLMVPPVLWAYLLSQRRAAMIALFIGFAVVAAILYRHQPRRFWRITPFVAVGALGLIAVTWNAEGAIGLPATAIKSVLFPDDLSIADRNSNIYRDLEAFNLWVTIQSSPIRGLGFGQKFLIAVPMPDISFFKEWQYLPHNSVLWVWIKLGFLGFVATLFMFARAIQRGTRTALRIKAPDDVAMVTSCLCYVIMFLVFAYVDIGWDIRPAVFLALCFAVCADFDWVPEGRRVMAAVRTREHGRPLLVGAPA